MLTDSNPITHIVRFVVGSPAPVIQFQEQPWSAAGGSSVAGNGELRRAVVDAALMVQSAADVRNNPGMSLPSEYLLPGDMDSLYPVANMTMQTPGVAGDHLGPAPGNFQLAMAMLDALPPCPTTPAQASQPQAPGSCLRRLALVEHQACPACWPTSGGTGNTCDTASPFFAANYNVSDPKPVLGPLASFLPEGLVNTTGYPNSSSAQFSLDCTAATFGIGPVPYRVMTGPAAIVDGRIARQPHGYADTQSEFVALSNASATGRKLQAEFWDIHNFTPDMHPMHLHLVEFRIVARFVVGTEDLDGSGFIDNDAEVADGDCTNNAYWEFPEVAETFAAKDIAKVYPMASNSNSPLPFGQEFRPLCAPKTRIWAIFEDYAGKFVWHCHIIEHGAFPRRFSSPLLCLPLTHLSPLPLSRGHGHDVQLHHLPAGRPDVQQRADAVPRANRRGHVRQRHRIHHPAAAAARPLEKALLKLSVRVDFELRRPTQMAASCCARHPKPHRQATRRPSRATPSARLYSRPDHAATRPLQGQPGRGSAARTAE